MHIHTSQIEKLRSLVKRFRAKEASLKLRIMKIDARTPEWLNYIYCCWVMIVGASFLVEGLTLQSLLLNGIGLNQAYFNEHPIVGLVIGLFWIASSVLFCGLGLFFGCWTIDLLYAGAKRLAGVPVTHARRKLVRVATTLPMENDVTYRLAVADPDLVEEVDAIVGPPDKRIVKR